MLKRVLALALVLALLIPAVALADVKFGDTGAEVLHVQQRLNYYKYYTGSFDQKFGSGTLKAVKEFQTNNSLPVTGVVDAATLTLLDSSGAVPKASSTRTLKYKDKGEDVLAAQQRLAYYKYYTGKIDGIFGKGMEASVRNFQARNGLSVDGKIGKQTLNKLNSSTAVFNDDTPLPPAPITRTLKLGDEGADVLAAQQRLKHYGYYQGELDGKFGSGMETAVRRFQMNNELYADGKVGAKTADKLNSDTAVPYTEPIYVDTLKYGSHGDAVVQLQMALSATFYYNGAFDGIFGSKVESAVKAFQASTGLSADGKVGKATYEALFNRTASIFNGGIPRRTLSSGSRGWDVLILQQKLSDMNYLSGITVPGYFDSRTSSAVIALQKDNQIAPDGKVGPSVRRVLWPTLQDKQDIEDKEAQDGNTVQYVYQRTLRKGSEGTDVANMQMRLKAAGFLFGAADGVYGDSTVKAVKALQKYFGAEQDGVVGPTTWILVNALSVENAEPLVVVPGKKAATTPKKALKIGASDGSVAKLQSDLVTVNLLQEKDVDGVFGQITKAAVESFQRTTMLSIDGVAGSQTLATLYELVGTLFRDKP